MRRKKSESKSVDKPLRSFALKGKRPGANLSPELRSWIANCLVPILVDEYLEQRKTEAQNTWLNDVLASAAAPVRDSAPAQNLHHGEVT